METNKTPVTPQKTYVNGKQIEIVCRLCAKTDSGCTDVFSKVGKGKKLSAIIENLTGIGISAKDTLPKTVCRVCQRQLSSYMNFKNKCLEVQSTLSNVTVKRCKEFSLSQEQNGFIQKTGKTKSGLKPKLILAKWRLMRKGES